MKLKFIDIDSIKSFNKDGQIMQCFINRYWLMLDNKLVFNKYGSPMCNSNENIMIDFVKNFSANYKVEFTYQFIEKIYLPVGCNDFDYDLKSFDVMESSI